MNISKLYNNFNTQISGLKESIGSKLEEMEQKSAEYLGRSISRIASDVKNEVVSTASSIGQKILNAPGQLKEQGELLLEARSYLKERLTDLRNLKEGSLKSSFLLPSNMEAKLALSKNELPEKFNKLNAISQLFLHSLQKEVRVEYAKTSIALTNLESAQKSYKEADETLSNENASGSQVKVALKKLQGAYAQSNDSGILKQNIFTKAAEGLQKYQNILLADNFDSINRHIKGQTLSEKANNIKNAFTELREFQDISRSFELESPEIDDKLIELTGEYEKVLLEKPDEQLKGVKDVDSQAIILKSNLSELNELKKLNESLGRDNTKVDQKLNEVGIKYQEAYLSKTNDKLSQTSHIPKKMHIVQEGLAELKKMRETAGDPNGEIQDQIYKLNVTMTQLEIARHKQLEGRDEMKQAAKELRDLIDNNGNKEDLEKAHSKLESLRQKATHLGTNPNVWDKSNPAHIEKRQALFQELGEVAILLDEARHKIEEKKTEIFNKQYQKLESSIDPNYKKAEEPKTSNEPIQPRVVRRGPKKTTGDS
jgi:hypothetical protein